MSASQSHTPPGQSNSHREIASFVAAFERCTLPCTQWNHRAHLTVGLWYSLAHPPHPALDLTRSGIQRFNRTCGWPTTATTGYHETLTVFWLWAIRQGIASAPPGAPITALWPDITSGGFSDKTYPFAYYSRDRLMSWEARVSWLPPDIKPLQDFQ